MKKIPILFVNIFMIISIFNITFAGGGSDSVSAIKESVQEIVNAVAYFGYAIALGMLIYLGAKYAMSPANEKADVKQSSINYLMGALLIIGAATVANIFVDIAANGETDTGSLADKIVNATGGISTPDDGT